MSIRVFTDFDGPLVDVSARYFRVYQFCLEQVAEPGQPLSPLARAEFWACKRDRIPEYQIAIASGFREEQAIEFVRLRREHVHSQPYFPYDVLQADAIAALTCLRDAGIELATMTMRRTCELEPALERFGLTEFFPSSHRYCLADNHVKQGDTRDKPNLLAKALAELPPAACSWMIGDTEADLVAGSTHRIPTLGLLCGIRNRRQLERYKPAAILPSLANATSFILAELSVRAG
ncbi:HAD family hydrolase [Synechococcus sp. PCC 7336]|uniref:HAD family hydrolase n=1 Tax=Synechococcus sp. PCC 7336 TaxID=195250 RepID=UPI000346AD25|nr:HAD family hydrolase [Synechococcus sp. PCC 7336]